MHDYRLAYCNFIGGHRYLGAVAYHACRIGADVHQCRYALAALADGNALKQLTYLVEEHYGDCFLVIAGRKCADGGKCHKEFFVKELTVYYVQHGVLYHIVAYHDVGGKED